MFYADVEVPKEREKLDAALEDLERKAADLRILGVY
jgi:prephenate dehydratase